MKRRTVLGLGLVGVGASTSLIDISEDPPLHTLAPCPGLAWSGLLRTSPKLDQTLTITGAWPTSLRGTLYRNGPGRLERGGAWKRSLLDADRDGVGAPRRLEHDPVLFLHGINSFDDGDDVGDDLITYDKPSALFGANALLANVAADTLDRSVAPGRTARWRLSPGTGKVRSEPLPFTDCEMPALRPADVGNPYTSAWAVTGSSVPVVFFHGVARLDLGTGRVDRFDDGPQVFLSEPAPTADGHLLVHGLDAVQDRSFLAVFRAAEIAAGPVATAWLDRGVHPGFHGCWDALA